MTWLSFILSVKFTIIVKKIEFFILQHIFVNLIIINTKFRLLVSKILTITFEYLN